MQTKYPFIYIGSDTLEALSSYCSKQKLDCFTLVTDQNIYPRWGEPVQKTLRDLGFNVQSIILEGDPITPDENYLIKILLITNDAPCTYLAVGSGTITDMVRFVADRTQSAFISLPSAPSMDGYASSGSSLTIQGLKQTVIARPPIAIFADLPTLSKAPRDMIAAGFGDVFGKFTALADWAMGNLTIRDPYDPNLAGRVSKRLEQSVKLIDHLEDAWEQNIYALTDALLDVGLCMLEMGNSRPASGSEHSCSHYWEMKLLREGRPAIYHGTKVGIASMLMAERYEWIKKIDIDEVNTRLASTPMPILEDEISTIRKVYGSIADDIIRSQKIYLEMTPEEYHKVQERISSHWPDIHALARSVPSPEEMGRLLHKAGLPVEPEEINLTKEDVKEALYYGHYLRNPFTIIKLLRMLGIDVVTGE